MSYNLPLSVVIQVFNTTEHIRRIAYFEIPLVVPSPVNFARSSQITSHFDVKTTAMIRYVL